MWLSLFLFHLRALHLHAGNCPKRGIKIHTAVKVESISQTAQGISARISGMPDLDIDRVLVATGRRANTESLGLDSVGISTDRGFIRVNERMQSSVPGYYCIGDANGQCLLAHAASAQAVTAIKDALSQYVGHWAQGCECASTGSGNGCCFYST